MSNKLTKKQLAQKRNWFKYQLTGLHFNVQQNPQEVLTAEEWCYLQNLIDYRNKLIEKFEENSKILGLKVKDKFKWIDWQQEECNKIHSEVITDETIINVFKELNKFK